jgi:hypothetical protein
MKLNLHNAIIENIASRADGSYKVVLGLPELPPEEAVELFRCLRKEVVTAEVNYDTEVEGKTHSKRLRDTLWVVWDKQFKPTYPDFETFYKVRMEQLINQLKDKYLT